MKKTVVLLLLVLLTITAACQPTPEQPVVLSKGDGRLESLIAASPVPEAAYEAKDHITDTIETKDGAATIHIDANVVIPDSMTYPVMRVENREVDESFIKDMISRFSIDGKAYMAYANELPNTKSEIEVIIDQIMNELSDPNSDVNKRGADAVEKRKSELAAWQDSYNKAPESIKPEEIEIKLEPLSDEQKDFECSIKTKNNKWMYLAFNSGVANQILIEGQSAGDLEEERWTTSEFENEGFTKESAINLGKAFISQMGESGFEASYVETQYDYLSASEPKVETYWITFTRCVDNIKTAYVRLAGSDNGTEGKDNDPGGVFVFEEGDIPADDGFIYQSDGSGGWLKIGYEDDSHNAQYAPYFEQESIEVAVSSDGVCCMIWKMPAKYTKINSNVKMISFDEIQQILHDQMALRCLYTESSDKNITHHDVMIDRIELGYMQIREKNTNSGLIMIPVWNCFGSERLTFTEKEPGGYPLDENNQYLKNNLGAHSFLTINAIDGTIIDVTQGY